MSNNETGSRRRALAIILAVLVPTLAIALIPSFMLRHALRQGMISRDGDVLAAVASSELSSVRKGNAGLFEPGSYGELLEVALNTSQIRGVLAVRVFDSEGQFLDALPVGMSEMRVPEGVSVELATRDSFARFYTDMNSRGLYGVKGGDQGSGFSALEVWLRIRDLEQGQSWGYAQYWIQGESMAGELARLDRKMWLYGGLIYSIGVLVGGGLLYLSFLRLRASQRLLQSRTRKLAEAEQRLSLDAKTSAIGSITSHLIHGLKGPLASVNQFLTEVEAATDIRSAGKRMKALLDEVITMLQDQRLSVNYEMEADEFGQLLDARIEEWREPGMASYETSWEMAAQSRIGNARAGLSGLVLFNLVRNALEATPVSGEVRLAGTDADHGWLFTVSDTGPGLPEHVEKQLFQPVGSTKASGSGIGLALCQELTRHLGGRLWLERSDVSGTVFKLWVPIELGEDA